MSVSLHKYSNNLPLLFENEKDRISSSLGILDIHHVGSSAVPGLAGKNVIDILIGLDNFETDVENTASKLNKLGYISKFIDKKSEWAFLHNKEETSQGDFHIHIIRKGSKDYEDWFLFRDYLRLHSEEAKMYSDLKSKWLEQSGGNGEKYAGLKTDYIYSVIQKAREEGL